MRARSLLNRTIKDDKSISSGEHSSQLTPVRSFLCISIDLVKFLEHDASCQLFTAVHGKTRDGSKKDNRDTFYLPRVLVGAYQGCLYSLAMFVFCQFRRTEPHACFDRFKFE